MPITRALRSVTKYLAFELIALIGAICFFVFSGTLPEWMGAVLAALALVLLIGALLWRFVRVIRDPIGSVTWKRWD
jgi:hypothetical protein